MFRERPLSRCPSVRQKTLLAENFDKVAMTLAVTDGAPAPLSLGYGLEGFPAASPPVRHFMHQNLPQFNRWLMHSRGAWAYNTMYPSKRALSFF